MIFRILLLAFWLLSLSSSQTFAQPRVYPTFQENAVRTQLISEKMVVERGEKIRIGMLYQIEPNWHIYWKNPGDSGLPTEMSWQKGIATDTPVIFPLPERISMGNMTNYGYKDELLLFSEVTVPEDAADLWEIRADTSYLMCLDICLPGQATETLTLQTVAKGTPLPLENNQNAPVFERAAMKSIVKPIDDIRASYLKDDHRLILNLGSHSFEGDLYFIPAEEGVIDDHAEQSILVERDQKEGADFVTLKQSLSIAVDSFEEGKPNSLTGFLVHEDITGQITSYKIDHLKVKDGKHEGDPLTKALIDPLNMESSSTSSIEETAKNGGFTPLITAIFFAFIGGLILNLMPCVLPVLSLKVMGLIHHRREKNAWLFGLIYTLGILSTFMIMASIFVFIKSKGQELGWGFQLQSPAFVATLTIILLLIALELLHVFEIGTTFGRIQNVLKSKNKVVSTFLSGMLMTIVATPCTVPFMGGAVAYALSQDHMAMIYIIFLSLGLGLAFPYVVLTLSPRFSKFLPKPGAWETRLQEVLAFPMLATAVWLLWVYGKQTNVDTLAQLMIGLLVLSFGAWAYGHLGTLNSSRLKKYIAFILFYASLFFAITTYGGHKIIIETWRSAPALTEQEQQLEWLPWQAGIAEELANDHQSAFIDFTADWCITCKANKYATLTRQEMVDFFIEHDIITIEADWTKQDEEIGRELQKYDHSGVPLYLAIHRGEIKVLPQLLTIQTVKEAFQDAHE